VTGAPNASETHAAVGGAPCGVGHAAADLLLRRLARLREELIDEAMPLPLVGPRADDLLAELHYARRPPQHESRSSPFGALVFSEEPRWERSPLQPLHIPCHDLTAEVIRRFADGRSSFMVREPDAPISLASFEHSLADEVSAVALQRTGAIVVQRIDSGNLRVCAPGGVVHWNGSRWLFKPLAREYVRVISAQEPACDHSVLSGLLELAIHSLASARVGATLVWNYDGTPVADPRDGLLESGRAFLGPPLSVVDPTHYAALRSALGQVDLATVVAADGQIGPIGVRLGHRPTTALLAPPEGGARHISAQRFTHDVHGSLAVVVSASGRVTAFSRGDVLAVIAPPSTVTVDPATNR
jgi:Probable sensor domain DACNK